MEENPVSKLRPPFSQLSDDRIFFVLTKVSYLYVRYTFLIVTFLVILFRSFGHCEWHTQKRETLMYLYALQIQRLIFIILLCITAESAGNRNKWCEIGVTSCKNLYLKSIVFLLAYVTNMDQDSIFMNWIHTKIWDARIK